MPLEPPLPDNSGYVRIPTTFGLSSCLYSVVYIFLFHLQKHLYARYFSVVRCVSISRRLESKPGYGLDGPGIECRWVRDFPQLSRPALGPTRLLSNGYRVFPGGKERPGRDADPSPPFSAVVMKE